MKHYVEYKLLDTCLYHETGRRMTMKKLLIIFTLGLFIVSCNNETGQTGSDYYNDCRSNTDAVGCGFATMGWGLEGYFTGAF